MSKQRKKVFGSSSLSSVGWLFADLLLALAMLFLIANTVVYPSQTKTKPKPVPTKVSIKTTPTPTPLPRLELQFHGFEINVDPNGLRNGSQSAIDDVKNQVRAEDVLRNRSVGLVVAYGGAPTENDVNNALAIAEKVYDALRELGQEQFVFGRASYYKDLYILYGQSNVVTLDVYLFAQ